MHWNNGRFHENILVGKNIYITDHKHTAISGTVHYTQFGEVYTDSFLYGNKVNIMAQEELDVNSSGSRFSSDKYTKIISGNNNISEIGNYGIEIVSNNGDIIINSKGTYSTNIKSANFVNLNGTKGITVNSSNYGTSLPTTNNVEGKVFFKLIS